MDGISREGEFNYTCMVITLVLHDDNLNVHAAILSTDNMREIIDLTWEYRAGWRFIGIELGIDFGTLSAIEADNRKVEDCLIGLINFWLRNVHPTPTRHAMNMAIKSEHVTSAAGIVLYYIFCGVLYHAVYSSQYTDLLNVRTV